jgi:hypothetical protein
VQIVVCVGSQEDVLLPALTVAETIRYSALLRLPKSTPAEQIQVRCVECGVLGREVSGFCHRCRRWWGWVGGVTKACPGKQAC